MKKLISKLLKKNTDSGEFEVDLLPGDVFISLHSDNACIGGYLKQSELNSFEMFFSDIEKYLVNDQKLELKVIGDKKVLDFIFKKIESTKYEKIKKVERSKACVINFIPMELKLRVSLEETAEVVKTSPLKLRDLKAKIKVMIVDDSKTIRNILSKVFASDPQFEVVALAELPSQVEALILEHKPDVITLDIHMPEMDGVTLLKTLIAPKYNIPAVMISSISLSEGPMVLDALENGAVDYIQKPEMSELQGVTPLILEKVKTAALANMKKSKEKKTKVLTKASGTCNGEALIVLGASTGGTEAIREILTMLPNEIPPMLIVQHIPAVFSFAFAKRMNELCPFDVKEASHGDIVKKNQVLIAPGGKQMKMIHKHGQTFVEINDDEPVNRFKPSVDYLFHSVAESLYTHTVGVLLTGMGKDGARGMLALKNKGVQTIAQNEETSIVFGMPKEAIAIGGASYVEALNDIAAKIIELTHKTKKNSVA